MIGVVYDLIRYINGQVGRLAIELLDQAANRRRAARGEEAKHHAAS